MRFDIVAVSATSNLTKVATILVNGHRGSCDGDVDGDDDDDDDDDDDGNGDGSSHDGKLGILHPKPKSSKHQKLKKRHPPLWCQLQGIEV